MNAPDYADANQYNENGDPVAGRDVLDYCRDGTWLDSQSFPPLRWAVPDLIPEGFGLLTGPPKSGKSWLVLGVALAIASGGRALGRVPVGPARPVLYLALEDGPRRLQQRARTLLLGERIPPNLHVVTDVPPNRVLDLVGAFIDKHADSHPVVALDTLGRVMPPALPGESAYQRDYRVGAALKQKTDAHPGSTLLVVHHVRKLASTDWMDSTSGTNGLNGAADFTINLARPRTEDTGVVRVTGRDVIEGEYAVTCTGGSWSLVGGSLKDAAREASAERSADGLGDRSRDILRIVKEATEAVGPTQVGNALGLPANSAGAYLGRMADAGRLVRVGRGLYALPASAVESVESVESGDLPLDDSWESVVSVVSDPDGFNTSTLSTLPTGPGIGPCVSCGTSTRRYGDGGGPLCPTCREAS